MLSSWSLLLALASYAVSREITFPPVAGMQHPIYGFGVDEDAAELDITMMMSGITTFAHLPYVHCLANESEDVEKYDIAVSILGERRVFQILEYH